MSDTQLVDLHPATAIKMAEMNLTLNNVQDVIAETKQDVKALFVRLESIANTHIMVANLQENLNIMIRRSDERWTAHLIEYREQFRDTRAWREATEKRAQSIDQILANYRGAFSTINWVIGIVLALVLAFAGWFIKSGH